MDKTPDEIKRGLEYCISDVGCVGCVYYEECIDDGNREPLQQDALAYIRQLEADNAQKDRCIENLTDKLNAAHDEVAKWKAERDAAVKDLTEMGRCRKFGESCNWCNRTGCGNGCLDSMHDVGFEWRGVKEDTHEQ